MSGLVVNRLEIQRADCLNQWKSAKPRNGKFGEAAKRFYSLLYACTGYDVGPQEPTMSLLPRQAVCARNAISRGIRGNVLDAYWEIYDFIEASGEPMLSFAEKSMLCMTLELILNA